GDQYAADPRGVVPRIERVPIAAKKNLEPGREIHWRRVWRHSDISQIARAVPRWDVHAAAERNREVGEVAAYAEAFVVGLQSCACRTRVLIVKGNVVVDIVANGLDARTSGGCLAEQRPGAVG